MISVMRWSRTLAAAFTAAAAIAVAGAAPASADVVWLCHPDRPAADDPCETPLDTTVLRPGQEPRTVTPDRPAADRRPVDCFFVYPTVSNQLALNATRAQDPEIFDIAKWQASRFSQGCRMFAPIYRQATVPGIAGNALPPTAELAYTDVVEAWRKYLKEDNGGRGVILLGHSQGTLMLRQLVRKEIDPDPELRRRLVGGQLLGGNVTTAKGKATGGDWQHVPVCTRRGEAGCLVAYSTYGVDPLPVSAFGNASTSVISAGFNLPSGSGYEIACTDPATLSGQPGPVPVLVPSKPYAPGFIATFIAVMSGGGFPSVPTTWVEAESYDGSCRTINGAHVFRFHPVDGARTINQDPLLGGHIVDFNLGLGRLVTIAGMQTQTWLADRVAARSVGSRGTVEIDAPGPGTVEVLRKGFVRTRRTTTTRPGKVRLRVTTTAKGRRSVRRSKTGRLSVSVVYRPAAGDPVTRKVAVRLPRR